MNAAEFASLLCSRLCHDLVSPVGSLYNGVELLADETDPDMRARCMEMLADSARQTANKLKFFRLAFGAAGGFGDNIDTREAQAALEGLYASDKRVEVNWLMEGHALPKGAVKMLLNLAMMAGDALLRGGTLQIASEAQGDRIEVAVRAEGPRILLDESLKAVLTGDSDVDNLTPRAAGAYLVHLLAQESGTAVQISETEGSLVFGVTLSA
ncbi:histidine phosphotransferase [Pacificimonas sp. WHA3]|uniref:Histidine phosphotransferase n=1 Tax=Pacificimonas pallii TaxID=2827236 RepID=A0ABS6S9Z3_9SPHN|nr:histidine phosphotransferase family protein [Pacificimonas pallii]MBV7255179.1 histidine phosphotransferase [Pacificimonas pallii]